MTVDLIEANLVMFILITGFVLGALLGSLATLWAVKKAFTKLLERIEEMDDNKRREEMPKFVEYNDAQEDRGIESV